MICLSLPIRVSEIADTVTQETGTQDTGTQDTGTQDTGTQETGTQETGTQDTGTQETVTQETGTQDTGTQDFLTAKLHPPFLLSTSRVTVMYGRMPLNLILFSVSKQTHGFHGRQ